MTRAKPNDMTALSTTRPHASGRGSALIVVIAALALVAVFAAIYVTIGQSDRRTAASIVEQQDLASAEQAFVDHILDVVADDVFDVYPEAYLDRSGNFQQRFVRETTDYPYTDYQYNSAPTFAGINLNDADIFRFSPSGRHTVRADDINGNTPPEDYRVPSDPWLASSEPSFVGLSLAERVYSPINRGQPPLPRFFYMDNRDWGHISNIAPDGRFVNLFNIRGNFDALPGFTQGGNPGIGSDSRTSDFLSLLEPEGGDPLQGNPDRESRLQGTTLLPLGVTGGANIDLATNPDFRTQPGWYANNQRFMYFPLDPSFEILDDAGQIADWASPFYPDYQYADTDGDGMADARWFELADATDPDNPIFLGVAPGEYRFFAAVRIIDLSGRVNVNTATDGLTARTMIAPLGTSPSDIDLRRILTSEDAGRSYAPIVGRGTDRLSLQYTERVDDFAIRNQNQLPTPADYNNARFNPFLTSQSLAQRTAGAYAGKYAYDAIRRGIEQDTSALGNFPLFRLSPQLRFGFGTVLEPDLSLTDLSPFERLKVVGDPTNSGNNAGVYSPFRRLDDQGNFNIYLGYPAGSAAETDYRRATVGWNIAQYYRDTGSRNAADPADTTFNPDFGGDIFGVDDLAELLTFGGVNDDTRASRLEEVTSGRFDLNGRYSSNQTNPNGLPANNPVTVGISPLLSNRPTALDRENHDSVGGYPLAQQNPNRPNTTLPPDSVIDAETMAMLAVNPRLRLTTLSGARPLTSTVVLGDTDNLTTRQDLARSLGGPLGELTGGSFRYRITDFKDNNTGNRVDISGAGNLLAGSPEAWEIRFWALMQQFDGETSIYVPDLLDALRPDTPIGNPAADNATLPADVRPLFRYYADALLGESDMGEGKAWDVNDPTYFARTETLFYGHEGPELALRIAAHMALNFKDMNDADGEPTAVTLLVDGEDGGTRNAILGDTGADAPYAAGQNERNLLDLDRAVGAVNASGNVLTTANAPEQRLHRGTSGSGGALPESRRAANLFGIEPQPFLTEAGSLIVYSDAPRLFYDDSITGESYAEIFEDFDCNDLLNWSSGNIAALSDDKQRAIDVITEDAEVRVTSRGVLPGGVRITIDDSFSRDANTIDGTISADNDDLAFAAVAFQLHNPFDRPITFGVSDGTFPAANAPAATLVPETALLDYTNYIEWNGWYFLLAEYTESGGVGQFQPITLDAGETIVVYATPWRERAQIESRWSDYADAVNEYDGSTQNASVSEFVNGQFRSTAGGSAIRIAPFDPANPARVYPGVGGTPNAPFIDFWTPAPFDASNPSDQSTTPHTPGLSVRLNPNAEAVHLWRKYVAEDANGAPTEPLGSTPLWPTNDQLLDTLIDPDTDGRMAAPPPLDPNPISEEELIFGLDFERHLQGTRINDSEAIITDSSPSRISITVRGLNCNVEVREGADDGGLTTVRWASFRRPDHPNAAGTGAITASEFNNLRGIIPAWCIERSDVRFFAENASGTGYTQLDAADRRFSLNVGQRAYEDSANNYGLNITNFGTGVDAGGNPTFSAYYTSTLGDLYTITQNVGVPERPFMSTLVALDNGEIDLAFRGARSRDQLNTYDFTPNPFPSEAETVLDATGIATKGGNLAALHLSDVRLRDQFSPDNNPETTGLTMLGGSPPSPLAAPKMGWEEPAIFKQDFFDNGGGVPAAETHAVNEWMVSTFRMADLLLPLGIGPAHEPFRDPAMAAGGTAQAALSVSPDEYTTLAEALAAAFGYEPSSFYNRDTDGPSVGGGFYARDDFRYSVLQSLVIHSNFDGSPDTQPELGNEPVEFILDRGRLRLDDYIAFINQANPVANANTDQRIEQRYTSNQTAFTDLNGVFEPELGDVTVGPAVPLATRILSEGRTLDVRAGTPLDTSINGKLNINTASKATARALPGLSPSLERSLNGQREWAPSRVIEPNPPLNGDAARVNSAGVYGPTGTLYPYEDPASAPQPNTAWRGTADVAPTVIAYRDRTIAEWREPSLATNTPRMQENNGLYEPNTNVNVPPAGDFTPMRIGTDRAQIIQRNMKAVPGSGQTEDFADRGRFLVNGIDGINEQPGFSSIGELLAVTVKQPDDPTTNVVNDQGPLDNAPAYIRSRTSPVFTQNRFRWGSPNPATAIGRSSYELAPHTMTFLGNDWAETTFDGLITPTVEEPLDLRVAVPGTGSLSTAIPREAMSLESRLWDSRVTGTGTKETDGLGNEYDEQLAQINQVLATVDVRSDLFAAYLLVRGYKRSDVEDLGEQDPMLPSYQKRFLMILDRSNVTTSEDQPRVILFREVPL